MTHEEIQDSTILVIDDNPTNLSVLSDYLGGFSFTVLPVTSGEKALKLIEKRKPDLILLDIVMPEMDGFEVCRRLKAQQASQDIPVLFLSALSETTDKVKGFEVGGVDYITKPFQQEEVLARVTTHLTICTQQQRLQAQNALLAEQNARLEEQKRLLEEKNEQLKQLNGTKDRFFSIISYNLRSPFLGLLGVAEFITKNLDHFTHDEIIEIVNNLRKSIENLYELLKNLLTWSSIQRGEKTYHPQVVHLKKLIKHNVEMLQAEADQKDITLRSTCDQEFSVLADYDMVYAILRNLVMNAIKFTHTGGTVTLAAKEGQDYIEISIADTGVGIPETDVLDLFRLDARYQKDGTAGEKGTGLGLILCKELVEKHGGKIWLESQAGEGTTVHFTLPKSA